MSTATRLTVHGVLIGAMVLLASAALANDTSLLGGGTIPPPPGQPTRDAPVLVISFADPIAMHNMSMTSDGTHIYTTNGGNASSGQVNTYDMNGNPISSVSVNLDARAILYSSATGQVYIKTYQRDWYQVDPTTGATNLVMAGIFEWSQSSPSITPDGSTIIEHENGTVRFLDASTGVEVNRISGFYYGGYPSSEGVATDGTRIFTWDGTLTQVYDMSGNPIESWNIPQGHYGFSLGWAAGLLWSATDGGGSTGTWYGYDVGGATPVEVSTWGAIKSAWR